MDIKRRSAIANALEYVEKFDRSSDLSLMSAGTAELVVEYQKTRGVGHSFKSWLEWQMALEKIDIPHMESVYEGGNSDKLYTISFTFRVPDTLLSEGIFDYGRDRFLGFTK